MPVSIVVGGQFGSEGKGKVALEIVRRNKRATTVVRVGGPNSGHTGYDRAGKKWQLRQMPAGSIDKNVDVVFPAGSYIDVDVLLKEVAELEYPANRIIISPFARIITDEHKRWERDAGLVDSIGSTGSGTGGAVMALVARGATNFALGLPDATHVAPLAPFIADTSEALALKLRSGERVVVEGTQGFGLSLLEGGYWPKATARQTTAAGALAEAGLSPIDVDDITMVIRSFPIRVAGNSGPLPNETTWEEIAKNAGIGADISEFTTVTRRLRRVGYFDPDLVKDAIAVNNPTRIVMNHLDYVAPESDRQVEGSRLVRFIGTVQEKIGREIDWYGFSPQHIVDAKERVA